jgi:pseudaminic acid cytidylyltransferase
MKKIAIIPARGGSKRIPGKNIKLFLGKPIIQYSIEIALKSGLFDEVMVSTDDHETAELSKKFGASVPFYRSAETSGDKIGLAEVVIEVLKEYSRIGREFEYCCCIFATAPFITTRWLTESYEKMIKKNFDTVFPIVSYPVPIQQSFKIINEDGGIEMFFDDQAGIMTQDYLSSYYDAGQYYWMQTERVKVKNRIDGENTGSVLLSEMETHDIDSEDDWKIAEYKYEYLHKNDD